MLCFPDVVYYCTEINSGLLTNRHKNEKNLIGVLAVLVIAYFVFGASKSGDTTV
jgi:hypothetical protein